MNRRDFLTRSGLALGALAFGPSLSLSRKIAKAAETDDRYYVFCYFEGGWDHLLGLDPRDPAIFKDADAPATGIEPAYTQLPAQFSHQTIKTDHFELGPCVGELAEITDQFSIVRGINMATLTHEVGRRYFITGRPPVGNKARGSSVASLATHQLGGDLPVPHLTHGVETYTENLEPYAAAMPVAAVDHLRFILREDLGIPTSIPKNVRTAVEKFRNKAAQCSPAEGPAASGLAATYRSNVARAQELVTSELWMQFEFNLPELEPVRQHYGFQVGQTETPFGRAALAGQALKTGLSRVVSVVLADQLDTHDQTWAGQHSVRLNNGFNALARLITDLRESEAPGGGSMLDKTTIFAFSEFGRTARLNARGGRDHLLTNCALLAGAGIKPGVVIGSSSDNALGPNLLDVASGQSSEEGISLKPEHVLTTVLHAASLDARELRSEPLPGLLA